MEPVSCEFRQSCVPPIIAWFCRRTGKNPQPNTRLFDTEQIREQADGLIGIRPESRFEVEQMLRPIECRITNEWHHRYQAAAISPFNQRGWDASERC